MKRWRLLAVGFGAYAIGLIVTVPATFVDAGLQRAGSGRLRLAEAQGTVWSGAGRLEIRDAGGRAGLAVRLAWRIMPSALLRARLAYEVELDQASSRFPVTISLSHIEVGNADIRLPAAALGLAVPKLAPLRLTSDVMLRLAGLSFGRTGMQGSTTLQWRAAGSAYTPISPLGDYELRVEGHGPVVRASLRTLQGPLQLDGQGSWAYGDNPVFLATARITPEHQRQLAPLLRLIALERGEGRFELQLK